MIAHAAANDKLARAWLDYGVSRYPTAPDLKQLSDMLANK